jgi:hypothetical protein
MVHGTGVGEWAAVSWRPRDGARAGSRQMRCAWPAVGARRGGVRVRDEGSVLESRRPRRATRARRVVWTHGHCDGTGTCVRRE